MELLGLLIVVHVHFHFSRHSLSLDNRQQLVLMKTKQQKSHQTNQLLSCRRGAGANWARRRQKGIQFNFLTLRAKRENERNRSNEKRSYFDFLRFYCYLDQFSPDCLHGRFDWNIFSNMKDKKKTADQFPTNSFTLKEKESRVNSRKSRTKRNSLKTSIQKLHATFHKKKRNKLTAPHKTFFLFFYLFLF